MEYKKGQVFLSWNGKTRIEILSDPNDLGQITLKEDDVIFYSRPKKFVDAVININKAKLIND